ncbi:penicillin acylase family protein [Synechocystis sp. B12]|nr:penicillin acylase family protein [Synechocystis sp. B12]
MLWALTIGADKVLGGQWNPVDPLNTPSGMADINKFMAVLEGVAAQVKFLYDDLAISWGEVVQMQVGNFTAPANGAPSNLGSFRVLTLSTIANQRFQAVAGDSYLSLVEFADRPRGQSILVYGNASQPNSPITVTSWNFIVKINCDRCGDRQGKSKPTWKKRKHFSGEDWQRLWRHYLLC